MSATISWMHLTDLHLGQGNSWLWPGMRQEFYNDLSMMADLTGPWDIVFFTGDFVSKGEVQEYKELSSELDRLWKHFRSLGSDPILICVPGNHDLQRPSNTDPITRQSLRWHEKGEEDVKNEFWADAKSPYRRAVERSLKNYVDWIDKLPIPKPELTKGILPGDFSAVIEINGVTIGVIGLNTTFLQLGGGNYDGGLDIHVRQLHTVCKEEAEAWRRKIDLSILMTHQPPSWLHKHAEDQLSEIYALGRFDTHLTGHLHKPEMHDTALAGGSPRRLRQGASLFGLEHFGSSQTRPLFGYMLGRWNIKDETTEEILWPRVAATARDGARRLGPDRGYHLNVHNSVTNLFVIKRRESWTDQSPKTTIQELPTATSSEQRVVHPEKATIEEDARIKLKSIPRIKISVELQHKAVRTELHVRMADALQDRYVAWLVSDWGLGKDGFISSVIENFTGLATTETFSLQCGDAKTCDDIHALPEIQFGITLQEFCAVVSSQQNSVLILDDLPATFLNGGESSKLERTVLNPIREFCPNLRLILVGRQQPRTANPDDVFVLLPLEVHETREYLKQHPRAQRGLDDPDTLVRIQTWSEGSPMRLESLLEHLQVFSLAEILNEDFDGSNEHLSNAEPVPHGLREAVSQLFEATTTQSSQSLQLLKILTVLRDGETFQAIKRFYHAKPFYINNVTELSNLNLLKAVEISQTAVDLLPQASRQTRLHADAPKLLRVPIQVRDYLNGLILSEERDKILRDSTDLLFGKKWREGPIQLRRELENSYHGSSISGPGNEHVVAQHLLLEAFHSKDELHVKRAIRLYTNLCNKLISLDRFRDGVIASDALVHFLRDTPYRSEYAEVARLNGNALRMMDFDAPAVEMLNSALEHGSESFTKSTLASVHLNLALAYSDLDRGNEALAAAKKVVELSHPEAGVVYQAKAVIAKLTLDNPTDVETQLLKLLRRARQKNHDTAANNIALDLAKQGQNLDASLRYLEDVFRTEKGNYTRTRAIVQKVSLLSQIGQTSKLTTKDKELLSAAYSYSYGQRIGNLLDKCHEVMWEIFFEEGIWASMLRLFRLSSFFWRIKGNQQQEVEYLQHFDALDVKELQRTEGRSIDNEVLYLEHRRRDHP